MVSIDQKSRHTRDVLKELKEHIELKEQASARISESARKVQPMRGMSQANPRSNVGAKLKKAGVALIALPDPVTGAIGVPVLATGYALEKLSRRDLTLPQVSDELAKAMKDLERLRRQALR